MNSPAPDDDRRLEALRAALPLFLRFGYRKTSMDQVARAAGVSRQALYLWFPGKEALFTAAVDQGLQEVRQAVEAALDDTSLPLQDRLLGAFDAYISPFLGAGASAASLEELFEATARLLGDRAAAFDAWFRDRLTALLHDRPGATARQLADVLMAVSAGHKYQSDDMSTYRARMARDLPVVLRQA